MVSACPYVSPIKQFLNEVMDFHKSWYEFYDIRNHLTSAF
jgi:hypothetical protein